MQLTVQLIKSLVNEGALFLVMLRVADEMRVAALKFGGKTEGTLS